MREYIFTGSVTLNGVTFFVEAENAEAAKESARHGKYREYDAAGAETIDWEIKPDTIEEN